MKVLSGAVKIAVLMKEYPKSKEILVGLGILADTVENLVISEKTLVELAQLHKIPLPVLLNNLSKATGLEVEWPKISGLNNGKADFFEGSSGLRKKRPEKVKRIIAVHSGKGGVGKTTIAISLALKAVQNGFKVGLLDLDIDCPNIPLLLNLEGKLITGANKKILPLLWKEIKIISMGSILDQSDQPITWRGPILAKAVEQLLLDSDWGDLDILIVDLPPGTGEIPLTLVNIASPDGVLIISTPNLTAYTDALKSAKMFENLEVKVVGVLENMMGFSQNSQGEKLAEKIQTKFWGMVKRNEKIENPNYWQENEANLLDGINQKNLDLLFS